MEKQKTTKKAKKIFEQRRLMNQLAELESFIKQKIDSSSLKEELLFCVAEMKKTAFSYKELIRLGDFVACAKFRKPDDIHFKALYRREFDKIIETIVIEPEEETN